VGLRASTLYALPLESFLHKRDKLKREAKIHPNPTLLVISSNSIDLSEYIPLLANLFCNVFLPLPNCQIQTSHRRALID
jgi:hypothetical protein